MNLIRTGTVLEQLTEADEVWATAERAFAQAGFPFVIYLSSSKDRDHVLLRTNTPALYTDVPPADDPFLEYCCHSYEVTRTGVGYLETYDYLPEMARDFIFRAADLGFKTGLGLPMRLAGSDRFGGFNIGTRLGADAFEQKHGPNVETLRTFCLILHRRLEELQTDQTSRTDILSPREADVMSLIARGHSRKEIARQLSLSPNTVAEYTSAAYRKLGVGNRVEATKAFLRFGSSR